MSAGRIPDPVVAVRGFSRRDFLERSGLLIISFSASCATGVPRAGSETATGSLSRAAGSTGTAVGQVDSYLAVGRDGSVTVFTGRIDMGSGLFTSFTQFVADELDVPIERVTVIGGDTGACPDGGGTWSSNGVPMGAQPLRVSAATARKKLLELGAERLGTSPDQLTVRDGIVHVASDPSRRVAYGDLIGDQRFDIQLTVDQFTSGGPTLMIPPGVTLKTPDQHVYVGRSVPRVDLVDRLVTGSFCHNVRVPGMLHGRCVRPPSRGATLLSVDERSVEHIPGFVKLVVQGNFVGVVCQREEQAVRAARNLKATWSEGTRLPDSERLFQALRSRPADTRIADPNPGLSQGDVDAALAGAVRTMEATYEVPFHAHAMMGPTCAVADIQSPGAGALALFGRGTIWTGTQHPYLIRQQVASMLGLPTENLRVIWVRESGSYGRLTAADAAADAALLSQAVGRPVRVQWSREEEHRWAPHQPAMVTDVRAGLDAAGRIAAWDTEAWTTLIEGEEFGNLLAWQLTGHGPGPTAPRTFHRMPGSWGAQAYAFANVRSIQHYVEPVLRTMWMRSPMQVPANFATESFMDELAAAVGADPIDFRLRHLAGPDRDVDLIEVVRKSSGWVTRRSPGPDARSDARVVTGRGFARGRGVQMVVEVAVDRQTGKVSVARAWLAYSPGQIVNPDGLRNQLEEGTLQGFSRALMEEVTFDASNVTSVDWESHPILKFSDTPALHVDVVSRPDLPLNGAGEMATDPAISALGNAIFDATGVRVRRLPFTPQRILAALHQG